jgi:hypothetical protein
MAAIGSKARPMTYAISYGLAGGRLHAHRFTQKMKAAGFALASPETADIIIGHSGGCWLIPETAKPRLVVYVGMCLQQSELRQALAEARRSSSRRNMFAGNVATRLKSSYYSLTQPKRNLSMIRMAHHAKPVVFPKVDTVFVANRHDPWPNADALSDYINHYDWSFINMEGAHDDIWEHPERYVSIIKHYAGLLD